jgi:hypothetical protein
VGKTIKELACLTLALDLGQKNTVASFLLDRSLGIQSDHFNEQG